MRRYAIPLVILGAIVAWQAGVKGRLTHPHPGRKNPARALFEAAPRPEEEHEPAPIDERLTKVPIVPWGSKSFISDKDPKPLHVALPLEEICRAAHLDRAVETAVDSTKPSGTIPLRWEIDWAPFNYHYRSYLAETERSYAFLDKEDHNRSDVSAEERAILLIDKASGKQTSYRLPASYHDSSTGLDDATFVVDGTLYAAESAAEDSSRLHAFDLQTGKKLWSIVHPGRPISRGAASRPSLFAEVKRFKRAGESGTGTRGSAVVEFDRGTGRIMSAYESSDGLGAAVFRASCSHPCRRQQTVPRWGNGNQSAGSGQPGGVVAC